MKITEISMHLHSEIACIFIVTGKQQCKNLTKLKAREIKCKCLIGIIGQGHTWKLNDVVFPLNLLTLCYYHVLGPDNLLEKVSLRAQGQAELEGRGKCNHSPHGQV